MIVRVGAVVETAQAAVAAQASIQTQIQACLPDESTQAALVPAVIVFDIDGCATLEKKSLLVSF